MSKKHKKVCTTLNYTKYFPIIASTITGCISVSAVKFIFASLLGTPIQIKSSAIGSKVCAIALGIRKDVNI